MSATLGLGCAPDIADNTAVRCASASQCDDGFQCYRGFCVANDGVSSSADAGGSVDLTGDAGEPGKPQQGAESPESDAGRMLLPDGGRALVPDAAQAAGESQNEPASSEGGGGQDASAVDTPTVQTPPGGDAPESTPPASGDSAGSAGGAGDESAGGAGDAAANPGRGMGEQGESQRGRGNANGQGAASGKGESEGRGKSDGKGEADDAGRGKDAELLDGEAQSAAQNGLWPSFGCDMSRCCAEDARGGDALAASNACCPASELVRNYRCEVLRLLGQVP